MKLVTGLGNPGAKYAGNRHNIGFMTVDRIAGDHWFSPWKKRAGALVAEGRLGDEKFTLLKPQGFMNLSGQAVGEMMRYLKLSAADVIVFHDELDLAPAKIRVKDGGGHAGHNGLRSIHQHIGECYHRVRLGIGHPGHKDQVASYVLSDFSKAEWPGMSAMLDALSSEAALLAKPDLSQYAQAVSQRLNPPRSGTGTGDPRKAAGRQAATRRDPKQAEQPTSQTALAAQFSQLRDALRGDKS